MISNIIIKMTEEDGFKDALSEVYGLYIKHGARSNKNIMYFHNHIKNLLLKIFKEPHYNVLLEHDVKSYNSSGKKKCDIVVMKFGEPYIIFPVKIIKSNYKQNKNNGWENLTGELLHLKWSNDNIHIIPINIFMNKTPYLNNKSIIETFENITLNDIKNYDILNEKKITFDIINYIILVEPNNKIGEKFENIPTILGFDENTPYRNLIDIVRELNI